MADTAGTSRYHRSLSSSLLRPAWPRSQYMGDASAASAGAARRVDLVHARRRRIQVELALRVVARAALHGLHVAAQQLLEAERRARGAGTPRRRRRGGPPPRRRRRPSRPRARRSARRARSRSIVRPHSSVGWRSSAVQSRDSSPAGAGLLPHLEQLERAQPRACGRAGRSPRRRRARARPAPRGAPRGPRSSQPRRRIARAHRRVGRRAQLEVGQRGLEVEARAADDDRPRAPPPAPRRSPRGRSVGELRRPRRSPRPARTRRSRCSSRARSSRRRRAGERLEAAIDLERVGGDRDRVLPLARGAARRARSRPPSSPPRWGRRSL